MFASSGGRIMEIAPELSGAGSAIDATGLHIFPGIIDAHLHFNEPGRTEWEGAGTGSCALAAGGGTLFFDMPLNSTPCTVNADEVDRKRAALEASSITDFGLWGGLIPGSVGEMAAMADRGVVGFKAFMCDSGLPEFPRADDQTLSDGMREAARLDLPVAVHAESQEMTGVLAAGMTGSTARDFLDSRPVAAELEAISRAIEIAGETGARLHIVHVSSGSGVVKAKEARDRGIDVSVETCPHYLFFSEDDLEAIGVAAKCAPPLRDLAEHAKLWGEVLGGRVDLDGVGSFAVRSVIEEERRLPCVVGRRGRRAVDAGRSPRAGTRWPAAQVRAHRRARWRQIRPHVSESVKRRAERRE